MKIFFADLDQTLIYSYKHEIGSAKQCAEIYKGREVSFLTEKTVRLLRQIKEKALIVPVTTRTVEQYERVDLGIGTPAFALSCNGGVLLANGREDASWFLESKRLVAPCEKQLAIGKACMERDKNRCFEVRNIRGLFLFTKSEKPKESAARLKAALDGARMEVFCNGAKVYAVPKVLNKGTAVKRFGKRMSPELTIAAGDSAFDVPMLLAADFGIAPQRLREMIKAGKNITYVPEKELFSEGLLERVMDIL